MTTGTNLKEYMEALHKVKSEGEKIKSCTGFIPRFHVNWNYETHELFVELAIKQGESPARYISSMGDYHISVVDNIERAVHYFLTDSNEINEKLWDLYKLLAKNDFPEEYEG